MSVVSWLRRLWFLLRRDRMTEELEEEMRLHRELRAEQLRTRGLGESEAEAAARRRFGNVTLITERSGDTWGFGSLDQLRQDIRFAARRLRQRPAFSIPVIVILALGIGATTAVFSAVDAAMLRSLPFPRAHELFTLPHVNIPFDAEFEDRPGGILEIDDVRALRDLFTGVAAYASGGVNLVDEDRPTRLNAGVVTTGFFETLGVRPIAGRTFSQAEGQPNGPLVALLSHSLWQTHFGGGDVVGHRITLHGQPYTVIGVMPRGFAFPAESQLWVPLSVPTTSATFSMFRGYLPSRVIARTRAGLDARVVEERLLAAWTAAIAPATGEYRQNLEEWLVDVRRDGAAVPLQRQLLGNRRQALLVFLGATLLLLLIACANVANLLLSDGAIRRREIALRAVLGATRRRIARQLLVESVLLSLLGATLGIAVALASLRILRAVLPPTLASVSPALLDLRVLAFAAALGVVAGLVFGSWPAVGATRGDAGDAIKSGSGGGATATGLGRVRGGLVVAEVGLTVMLLVAAGLMIRSFDRLMSEDLGIRPARVATLETSFPGGVAAAERTRVVEAVLQRLRMQPGITEAGAVNDLPLRPSGGISIRMTPHGSPVPERDRVMARYLQASGGYFAAMGIPLLRGRTFDPSERDVAVISSSTADGWWPGMDPLGRTFSFGGDGPPITVVGVVADIRERTVDAEPTAQMYQSLHQQGSPNVAFVVRGTLPPAALLARLSAAMREVAPTQAVYNVRMMEDVIGASVLPRRTNTLLIAAFAGIALVLSALGVYAVVAYGVAQRTREFGIRTALGARGPDLVWLVTSEIGRVLLVGLGLGVAGAWAASRVLGSLLYEVDARDPATFAVVPLVLVLPALAAALVPALRAARVDPRQVMQSD